MLIFIPPAIWAEVIARDIITLTTPAMRAQDIMWMIKTEGGSSSGKKTTRNFYKTLINNSGELKQSSSRKKENISLNGKYQCAYFR